ncbi:biotin synthase auxiliary protein BsaP [Tsukamurella soli]|uniref:biotin synthase auxiliary protein BsaP n=1 Tax=Tsukamurella soli TaxID=644556 RepID=UPI0031E64EF1
MYCEFTGHPLAENVPIPETARLGLEPPRYCRFCGRRMIVQVAPHGWHARCSRHGDLESTPAGELGRLSRGTD